MKSLLLPFLLAALVTVLIGVGVRMTPYFAGDVQAARALQAASPTPGWWATPISRLAPAPGKYYVMGLALVLSIVVAGWKGLLIVGGFLLLEQYGAESTKAWFARPRPSRELIAVVGSPSGFSFPSTTITFFSVTFGAVALLAARSARSWRPARRAAVPRWIAGLAALMLAAGCAARVAVGAHWPSDVILTAVICLTWIWATARAVGR
jgi:membrane-associated phospholipid phosphatase